MWKKSRSEPFPAVLRILLSAFMPGAMEKADGWCSLIAHSVDALVIPYCTMTFASGHSTAVGLPKINFTDA